MGSGGAYEIAGSPSAPRGFYPGPVRECRRRVCTRGYLIKPRTDTYSAVSLQVSSTYRGFRHGCTPMGNAY